MVAAEYSGPVVPSRQNETHSPDACEAPIAHDDRQALVDCVGTTSALRMHSTCVAIWQFQSAHLRN